MRKLLPLLLLLIVSACRVSAQTITHSTNWPAQGVHAATTGPNQVLADNWTDTVGGSYRVDTTVLTILVVSNPLPSANYLIDTAAASQGIRDQQQVFTSPGFSTNLFSVLRLQTDKSAYLVGMSSWGTAAINLSNSGGYSTLATASSLAFTPSSGDTLRVTSSVTGINPATLTATVYDVTTSQAVSTVSVTNSQAALQQAGQIGITGFNGYSVGSTIDYNLSAASATSYTTSLSAANGVAGSPVTLTLTPNGTSTATITPQVSGVSGTFSPATVTFAGSSPVTVAFTPSTTGTATLTSINSGSLTNPASQTYAVLPAPITIGVASAARRQSPGNWSGDTGRGGSVYRYTWTPGAYGSYYWSSPTASTSVTLNVSNATSGSTISYTLDGVLTDNISLPTSGGINIPVTLAGAHILTFYFRLSNAINGRWTLINALKETGLTVDGAATLGTAPALGKWILMAGDSNWESIGIGNLAGTTFLAGQAFLAAGYDYCVSACAGSGYIQQGASGGAAPVPAYYPVVSGTYQGGGRWNQIDANTSLLDSNGHLSGWGSTGQEPSAIVVNYNTNEAVQGTAVADVQASETGWLAAARGAAPNASLDILVPPGLYSAGVYSANAIGLTGPAYVTATKTGLANYRAAHPSDALTTLIDLGPNLAAYIESSALGSAIHYPAAAHALIAPQVVAAMLPSTAPSTFAAMAGQLRRGR